MHSLVEELSLLLLDQNKVLVTVESCTGGMIAAAMTDRAGSSALFDRGFVTYSNQSKMDLVGVQEQTLETYGAVSEQTAREMATGALSRTPADLAVSVTGIAGPTGGSDEKPVGLVYIGIAQRAKGCDVFKHIFDGDRTSIRGQTLEQALNHLIDALGRSA